MKKEQMDKVQIVDCPVSGQPIACSLHQSHVCPLPDKCDGIHRQCDFWRTCSGR